MTDLDHGDLFTVEDDHLRGDGHGTHHAAQVGPGVLCPAVRDRLVETVRWEHGVANVDCPDCLQLLPGHGDAA